METRFNLATSNPQASVAIALNNRLRSARPVEIRNRPLPTRTQSRNFRFDRDVCARAKFVTRRPASITVAANSALCFPVFVRAVAFDRVKHTGGAARAATCAATRTAVNAVAYVADCDAVRADIDFSWRRQFPVGNGQLQYAVEGVIAPLHKTLNLKDLSIYCRRKAD